jgi:ElaB/YqjD/DUF883 family membrane-anchored ribosome-binding protein
METYFSNMFGELGSKGKLVEDLHVLVHDAEELVKVAGANVADKSKEELNSALERVKASCRKIEAKATVSAKQADKLIRQHPYESMGVALALGLLIGVLVNRE